MSGEGPKTAEQMFDAVVPASELQNLPDYKLYLRTVMNRRQPDLSKVRDVIRRIEDDGWKLV